MEREAFFSGYCRQMDDNRMVCVEADGNHLMEADCLYETCPYGSECAVHEKIEKFLQDI